VRRLTPRQAAASAVLIHTGCFDLTTGAAPVVEALWGQTGGTGDGRGRRRLWMTERELGSGSREAEVVVTRSLRVGHHEGTSGSFRANGHVRGICPGQRWFSGARRVCLSGSCGASGVMAIATSSMTWKGCVGSRLWAVPHRSPGPAAATASTSSTNRKRQRLVGSERAGGGLATGLVGEGNRPVVRGAHEASATVVAEQDRSAFTQGRFEAAPRRRQGRGGGHSFLGA